MSRKLTRRQLVQGGAAVAAAPAVRSAVRPVVIASANGNKIKNGGPRTAVAEAFLRLTRGDDVVDAVIAGVNIVELDPADDSVGYGGLPNADGVVQLDASCMHGPKKRAGGVAALEGVRTPSLVARAVMESTDHHLLVGQGAQAFARGMGFAIEADLNTPHSRQLWLEWRRRIDPQHYLDPRKRADAAERARREMIAAGLVDERRLYGTINCSALNARGELGSVTTTSGLAWKIPGRVGDSPILGAGLWVDGAVGAAGSTGRGEANLYALSSFFIVEQMALGKHPKDAAVEALRRICANTIEKRLLGSDGRPRFGVSFYALDRTGQHAGVTLYAKVGGKPVSYAVCTDHGPETRPCEGLYESMAPE
jgi:N4-(beta-N-acetylglucosaminyl)-L-asparaginase